MQHHIGRASGFRKAAAALGAMLCLGTSGLARAQTPPLMPPAPGPVVTPAAPLEAPLGCSCERAAPNQSGWQACIDQSGQERWIRCERRKPSHYRHDGFYARLQPQVGVANHWIRVLEGPYKGERIRLQSPTLELAAAAGYSPAPGIAVALQLQGSTYLDPIRKDLRVFEEGYNVTTYGLGVLTSIYPNPRRGLHFDTVLGVSWMRESDDRGRKLAPTASGLFGSLGGGYDFWIDLEWSVGIVGQVTLASVGRSRSELEERHVIVTPALSGVLTFH